MFRISPKDLRVVAGVLNGTVESPEKTKVVREIAEIYLHEKFSYNSLNNDIALLKVGINFLYEMKCFAFLWVGNTHVTKCNRKLNI
jgi:N6-adenosine-specific RNA methylase IME4